MNHGQCQYCTFIGDIEKCLKQTCFIHDNWIVKYYQERIEKYIRIDVQESGYRIWCVGPDEEFDSLADAIKHAKVGDVIISKPKKHGDKDGSN